MKKYIFTLFLSLFVASSVLAQPYDFEKDDIYYHYDLEQNTLSVTSNNTNGYYSGDIVIPQFVSGETNIFSESIQRSIVMGVNSVGSFFTSNYGVQRITELGDNATNVIFALEVFDDEFRIISGTEAENEIVKSQSSETKFVMIGDATAEKFIKADWSQAKNSIGSDRKLEHGKKAVAFKNDKLAGFFEVMAYDSENNELQLRIWTGKIEKVSFTATVTSIEGYAFYGCANLTSVIIPSTVTEVGEVAFYGCTKLKDVTCLAITPPDAYANSFENYNGYLHVPCESKDDYDFANCWGSFKHVECIGAESVELPKDEVKVEPERSEAVFTMPQNESANSYTLTIQNNGVTFCTLTFNSQGQLANIDFSITKSYELKAGVSGYQFTVTGLSEATNYGYSFKALASNKSVLKEYTGSFTTKNADGTGGSSSGGEGTLAVDNISADNTVTITNNQILVNGEAPTFVITISGQKIANQNLKAGVYFVNVEGETVKVVK